MFILFLSHSLAANAVAHIYIYTCIILRFPVGGARTRMARNYKLHPFPFENSVIMVLGHNGTNSYLLNLTIRLVRYLLALSSIFMIIDSCTYPGQGMQGYNGENLCTILTSQP